MVDILTIGVGRVYLVDQREQIMTIKGAKLPGDLPILGDDRSFQSLLGDTS